MVENDWDVVSYQFIVKSDYHPYPPKDGVPKDADVEFRRAWTDHIACKLRNGQIIRVRKKEVK